MNLLALVFVNLGRNKIRTALTLMSVMVALFLFCALRGVLDTLQESIKAGAETRLVVRNAVSLVQPLPQSYKPRLEAIPGVARVAKSNWFGGQDPNDAKGFFAQFAGDDDYIPIYNDDVEIVEASAAPGPVALPRGADPRLAAYYAEQTACIVGRELMTRKGWKLGQTITISGTIYPGDWPMTIRAVYRAKQKNFGEQTLLFHYTYLEQKGMGGSGLVGIYILQLADPQRAGDIAKTVDAMFLNSSFATLTESSQAFQAGFVSMYGNVPFLIGLLGIAVVFAILLVAANTMVMAMRERVSEFGVLKTLGFEDGTIFTMVLVEAAIITLGGGIVGALAAKYMLAGVNLGFLPPLTIYWSTIATGIVIALVIGAVSGLVPAWQASRLVIVDALRRVD
ncbi:MAG: FtsX-like permease family protein [Candidatus Eisenbacteria bacterium]|uniref:FtsX-like permease family protein n=1 Tax=Eiseniibacteriota bacterium TaxID=2212470 RepID=A0A9D6LCB8_UNCEI|nr:FtsX-like permease family protein [Candidatus Eisenbacteria bacterium]MBI3540498.1 FtsX-like permease family protein [Candidatus Eisenbacteria bacterium]